ncbi:MAG: TRAM domain-containing protein, partial [Flavobacteriaceae bacterium]
MKKGKVIKNVKITDWMSDGKGFAKLETGQVIFIDKAFPGDLVDVKVTKKKKDFLEGRVIDYVQKSPDRIEAFCDVYGICGGCKLQDIDYEKQMAYKQKVVLDAFKRIGKIEVPETRPILGSAKTKEFRNKLEYTYTAEEYVKDPSVLKGDEFYEKPQALGFHVPGRF